jgi:hypothetical protein
MENLDDINELMGTLGFQGSGKEIRQHEPFLVDEELHL